MHPAVLCDSIPPPKGAVAVNFPKISLISSYAYTPYRFFFFFYSANR